MRAIGGATVLKTIHVQVVQHGRMGTARVVGATVSEQFQEDSGGADHEDLLTQNREMNEGSWG
jgi:hypothetical protein